MRDDRTTVSVVIPVLNGARWLASQLEALSVDGAQPFETIIADNGSTDDSTTVARSFHREMTVIVIDASERRGQSFARNLGARAATGDLLLFLDQDDEIGPGYVSAMVSALHRAELVAARMDDHKLNNGWRRYARTLPQTSGLPSDPVPWAYGCTLGVRRNTFERLGGFAEDLGALAGEDVDFCRRAYANGVVLTFVEDAILHYRYPGDPRWIVSAGRYLWVRRRHGRRTAWEDSLHRPFIGDSIVSGAGSSLGHGPVHRRSSERSLSARSSPRQGESTPRGRSSGSFATLTRSSRTHSPFRSEEQETQ